MVLAESLSHEDAVILVWAFVCEISRASHSTSQVGHRALQTKDRTNQQSKIKFKLQERSIYK
jgi:hypothetical protein